MPVGCHNHPTVKLTTQMLGPKKSHRTTNTGFWFPTFKCRQKTSSYEILKEIF